MHVEDQPKHAVVVNRYTGRWVVITGIRDIVKQDMNIVSRKMIEIVHGGPDGIIFGGARGVDTLALIFAKTVRNGPLPRLVVVVPGYVADQPVETRQTTRECADEIIEMGKKGAYFERNRRMVTEAKLRDPSDRPICVGFPSELPHGGTRSCMSDARRMMVEVEEVLVGREPGGVD